MKRRRLVLALALVATLLAVVWAPDPQGNLVMPTRRGETSAANPAETMARSTDSAGSVEDSPQVLELRPRFRSEAALELFSPPQPDPAPVPPEQPIVAPPPPPPPQAPPLPFRVLGRYVDGSRKVVFLQIHDRNIAVRNGDVIDGRYRVVSADGPVLEVVYLPLNQTQTLFIGAPL